MAEPEYPQLPANAENISARGFNFHAGPFYRLTADPDGMGARYAFKALEKHMNSAGTVHGGLLMTFADVAMSRTARLVVGEGPSSTVSFSFDFVGPGRLGDVIEASVRIRRRTRSVLFQGAELTAGERLIALASGVWRIGG